MKSEIYNAIASMNQGFDLVLEALKELNQQGVIPAEFVSDQDTCFQEMFSGVNYRVMHNRTTRELDDRDHFGKMRETIERRRKGEQTIEGLPPE